MKPSLKVLIAGACNFYIGLSDHVISIQGLHIAGVAAGLLPGLARRSGGERGAAGRGRVPLHRARGPRPLPDLPGQRGYSRPDSELTAGGAGELGGGGQQLGRALHLVPQLFLPPVSPGAGTA